VTRASSLLLLFVILPVWVGAGLADWWCHRRSGIEHSAGLPENTFHFLMFSQMALGAVLVAMLEINLLVLTLLAVLFLMHELTTYAELRYATPVRPIAPLEQMIHSFLEVLPLLVLILLAGDVLVRNTPARTSWAMQIRDGLTLFPLCVAALAVVLLNVVPLIEERLRCVRAARHQGLRL
jgi:hypothetical protein